MMDMQQTRPGSLQLFSAFANAATSLRASQRDFRPQLRLASFEVSGATVAPARYSIQGLPALLRFRCPKRFAPDQRCDVSVLENDEYTGTRSSIAFQRFVLDEPLAPEIQMLPDRASLDLLVQANALVVMAVVEGRDSSAYFNALVLAQQDGTAVAASRVVYVVSSNASLLDTAAERQRVPVLVLYRCFGQERRVFPGIWSISGLQAFVQENRFKPVLTYSSKSSSYFYDPAAHAHVLIFSDDTADYHVDLLAQTHDVASRWNGGDLRSPMIRFIYVPKNESVLRQAHFVPDALLPSILLVQNVTRPATRLDMCGADLATLLRSANAFASRVNAFLNALVLPPAKPASTQRRLEEVPDAVTPIASIQELLALRASKDLVVLFASPRCLACRMFRSTFDEAASAFVGIAMTLEQAEGYAVPSSAQTAAPLGFGHVNLDQVEGLALLGIQFRRLPTIAFFPRGPIIRDPVTFESAGASLQELQSFIRTQVALTEQECIGIRIG